jgi:hypothetical protein
MFFSVSPGPFGYLVGPNIWYRKKTHSTTASKPRTRIGRAIAIIADWSVLCSPFKKRRTDELPAEVGYFPLIGVLSRPWQPPQI